MPRYERWGLLETLHNFPTQLKMFTFQCKVLLDDTKMNQKSQV